MSDLRTSRRQFSHVKPPRFAVLTPLIWLLLLTTLGLAGFGFYQQIKPSSEQITAVVDGDLPLHINQQTVDAAFAQKPAYYPDKVVIGVTTEAKGSDGVQKLMDEKDADIVLSMDPETGWSSLIPQEMDYSQDAWEDYQAYPYDKYGISVNPNGDLSHFTTEVIEDLELSIAKNTTIGHGAKTIQAISTQIDKQHSFEKADANLWFGLALVPLLLALILTMRHLPRNRAYQNTYYRFAKASSLLNMVVLNIDVLEAALTIDNLAKSQKYQLRAIDALDQKIFEAQPEQEKLTGLIGSRRKMLYSEQQNRVYTFEQAVKSIVEDYNRLAISSGIVIPQESRFSDIYGITGDSVKESPITEPKKRGGCLSSIGALILANFLVSIPAFFITVQMQSIENREISARFAAHDHAITRVDYVGNEDDVNDYILSNQRSQREDQKTNDPMGLKLGLHPELLESTDSTISAETQRFFEEDATMVVVPLGKTLSEIFPEASAYEEDSTAYPDVSTATYLTYLQDVKSKLGPEYIDQATFEIKDNVIVVPSIYKWQGNQTTDAYLPPLIGMAKDSGNHYYDTHFLLMKDGGSKITIYPEIVPDLTDYQQMFTRTYGTAQSGHETMIFLYSLALNWGLIIIVFVAIRHRNGAIIASFRARSAYTSKLGTTREIIHQLALKLDDARLNSLILPAGAAPSVTGARSFATNDVKRAEYESALAEAWYHLQVLESMPGRLRTTSTLQSEADKLLDEAFRLQQWHENVALRSKASNPTIDQRRK